MNTCCYTPKLYEPSVKYCGPFHGNQSPACTSTFTMPPQSWERSLFLLTRTPPQTHQSPLSQSYPAVILIPILDRYSAALRTSQGLTSVLSCLPASGHVNFVTALSVHIRLASAGLSPLTEFSPHLA